MTIHIILDILYIAMIQLIFPLQAPGLSLAVPKGLQISGLHTAEAFVAPAIPEDLESALLDRLPNGALHS